ncbi:MAG: hypothetical protein COB37_06675 [Kordiimonadales bacterium]|nr:MAG: hypothetical protein COB37_06675 [Kordiimonadales bacterium]
MTDIKKKRVRRSPEEARAHILAAAAERLKSDGPDGLQVKEIAAVAGVAHSTVLHHFGSAAGLRTELVDTMGNKLLEDILAVIKSRPATEADDEVLLHVFEILSDEGHARLLAWMMLKGDHFSDGNAQMKDLFHRLIEEMAAAVISVQDDQSEKAWRSARRAARFSTMLAAVAAVGDGIAGEFLANYIGLTEKEAQGDFRIWFSELLNSQMKPEADEASS